MRRFVRPSRAVDVLAAALLAGLAACSKSEPPQGSPAPSAAPTSAAAAEAASAAPAAPSTASASAAGGPVVTIPKGKLIAGTACGDHPREPQVEPAGVSVELGEFTIDAYPYPNDPQKPPLTRVSQAEAKSLCEARGRRLCSELEWERACKGPSNTKYEYGNRFDTKKCPTGLGPLGPAGSHEGCKSGFGVYGMHGSVWEWTKSPWGRGDGEKEGSVALRGGFGTSPYADMRCSAAKPSAPGEAGAQVGFRCCGGPENSAEVELPEAAEDLAVIEAVEPLEGALVARVKRAIANGQLKEEPGFSYSIEKVWRWRPVKNEDLYVARYVATPSGGGAAVVQPVVVQLCERTALLLSRTRGPVSELGEPEVSQANAGEVRVSVKGGADAGEARFSYRFGQVNVAQPAWVKEGAGAASADAGAPEGGAPQASTSAAPSAGPSAAAPAKP